MNFFPKRWGFTWWKQNGERIEQSRLEVMKKDREALLNKFADFDEAMQHRMNEEALYAVSRKPGLPF